MRRGLGEQIKRLRMRRGLSQQALAAQAHLSRAYIAKLEAGERVSPAMPTLERLADVLGAEIRLDLVERTRRKRGA